MKKHTVHILGTAKGISVRILYTTTTKKKTRKQENLMRLPNVNYIGEMKTMNTILEKHRYTQRQNLYMDFKC